MSDASQKPTSTTTDCFIICQQIDVVIMGSKTFQLLQLLLDKDLNLVPMPTLKNRYTQALCLLWKDDNRLAYEPTAKFPKDLLQNKIQTYTTHLVTRTFWLQFNFFFFGALSHDPLLAPITRHKIPICILTSGQTEPDKHNLKSLLIKSQAKSNQKSVNPTSSATTDHKTPRLDMLMEHKIYNLLHNCRLNQFSSILNLKYIDKHRIIQCSSGLKLGRNQILRWLVDRYFEVQQQIKLRGQIGDEIENYEQIKPNKMCAIM